MRHMILWNALGLLSCACVDARAPNPLSPQALAAEKAFLKEVEKGINQQSHQKVPQSCSKQTLPPDNPTMQKPAPIAQKIAPAEPMPQKEIRASAPKPALPAACPCQEEIMPQKPTKKSEILPFSGLYSGISAGVSHVYPKADLWSIKHSPIIPVIPTQSNSQVQMSDPPEVITEAVSNSLGTLGKSQICTIYYGTYAYNSSKWLIDGQAFLGYDIPVARLVRIGLEVQGMYHWREVEVSSNGLYAERKNGSTDSKGNILPLTFNFNNRSLSEVDLAYTRPTLRIPYAVAILPRVGVIMHDTMLYTKLGMMYGPVKVTDNPETIEPSDTGLQKAAKDVVLKKSRASVLGGIGMETRVLKKLFIRMECMYAHLPSLKLEKNDLHEHSTADTNRQLEYLDVKSIKNFSMGFGAGVRF